MRSFQLIQKTRLSLAAFFVISLLPLDTWANQSGTSTAQFLRIAQGARAQGMGGAFVAVADDAHSTYWNPAGLAELKRKAFSIEYLSFIEDINTQNVALALPVISAGGTLGFSGTYVDLGSIERLDATGAKLSGDEDVNALSGKITWGQNMSKFFTLGFGVSYFRQDLAGEVGSGVAGDVGGKLVLIPDFLKLGASVSNISGKVKTGTVEENIPLTVRGGVALSFLENALKVAGDIEKERDTDIIFHVGTEYLYRKRFFARLGFQETHEADGGLSVGAGAFYIPSKDKIGSFGELRESDDNNVFDAFMFRFDYAYVDLGDFSDTHRIGVHLFF